MNYELFTDSSANLPDEIIDKYKLNIISLITIVDGKENLSYVKGEKTDLRKYYDVLRDKKTITTSCINEAAFIDHFEHNLKEGKDLLYIGFSSGLSATFSGAASAVEVLAKKYPERKIYAVDTRGASLGEGLLVYYACEMQKDGKSIEEVRDWLENNKFHLAHWFTVEDLYWLFKGGRVSATSYWVANLAKIKPVLHMDNDGHLIPVKKVLGRKHSLMAIVEKVVETIVNPEEQMIFISHGDCIEDAQLVADKISEKIKVKGFLYNYVDPVIGAHSGPGTIAVFFLATER